jgi:hypothetical protein
MKIYSGRKYLAGLTWVLLCISPQLGRTQAGFSVSGTVLDIETNLPLPNANVFIDKSLIGSSTDSSGHFQLANVPVGNFEIVASLIGYEAQKREIIVSWEFKDQIVFKLRPKPLPGPEVVVTAERDKQWRRDLEKFTALLLSTTKNVDETKILNPHFLSFSENDAGQFEAVACAPLTIENQALGYKLDFVLSDFVATAQSLRYAGYMKFEELEPHSQDQYQRWQKNRRRAYYGSLRHFLALICDSPAHPDRELKDQGFEVFTFKQPWERETMRVAEPVNWMTFFSPSKVPTEVYLSFTDYIGVRYVNEFEERNFLSHHQIERDAQAQESWIKLEQGQVKLDRKGRYLTDSAIMKFG